MTRDPLWPLAHAADVHSQNGEDGITLAILECFPERQRWVVEFGAWDGLHISNSRHLIDDHGYSAVLIEGNVERARRLGQTYAHKPDVHTQQGFVGFTAADGLDTILAKTPIPKDFDYLSIDIDGNDLHVWKACTEYRPKLVCIEFNPTIPTEVSFVQPPDPAVQHGASLRALVELGKEKGYELAAVNQYNAFFVEQELFPLLGIEDNRPEVLRADTDDVVYVFSGYDGTVLTSRPMTLPWHEFAITPRALQQLPSPFRRFPDDFGLVRRSFYFAYKLLRQPGDTASEISRKVRKRLPGSRSAT